MNVLGTSIKTSLIGYAGAVATALVPVIQGEQITLRSIVLAVVIAMLGRFAKDAGQTGYGT